MCQFHHFVEGVDVGVYLASCAPSFDACGRFECRCSVDVYSEIPGSDGAAGGVELVVLIGISVDLDISRALAEGLIFSLVLVDLPGVLVLAWHEDGGSAYSAWVL